MLYRVRKKLLLINGAYRADFRALALMRIGVALVAISDLVIRAADLRALYTNAGIWPSGIMRNFGWQKGFWSLHALDGSFAWALTLFILSGTAAVFLLIGYRSRLASFSLWLLTISLHNRNVFILQSGDDLLRLLLLWGCFLPWQHYYSVDSKKFKVQNRQFSLAYIAYLVLIASVYFFAGILKTSPEWHEDGTAVYFALSLEQLRLPFTGDWLYQHPGLMSFLTHGVYYIELAIPVFILLPSRNGITRWIAFLLIILIQTGFGLTLYVGLFFVISMVTALGLLPPFIMDKLHFFLQRFVPVMRLSEPAVKTSKKMPAFLKNAVNAVVLLLIAFCLIINLSGTRWFSYELVPQLTYPVNALRLNQYWGMFSPTVMKKDGWFVYHGVDSIGRQWDMRRNEDYVDYTKPEHIVSMYSSDRWRKLTENMQDDRFNFLRPLYCRYCLHSWNKQHPEKKLFTLNLYYMEKISLPAYKTTPPQKKLYSVCTHD